MYRTVHKAFPFLSFPFYRLLHVLKNQRLNQNAEKLSEGQFNKLQSLCTSAKATTSGQEVVFYMKMISLSVMLNSETNNPTCMSYKIPEVK